MDQELGEMHWKDGWLFKRLPNGSVRIRAAFGEVTVDGVKQPLRVEATIPAAEWASIVHHVGKEPTAEAMSAAMALHGV